MAAKEIPIAGYGPRLLGRVEVAEGTMAFHLRNHRNSISNQDSPPT